MICTWRAPRFCFKPRTPLDSIRPYVELLSRSKSFFFLKFKEHIRPSLGTVLSNVHISTPFFRKTVLFFKVCFSNTPWKFLGVCLNSESMWRWIPVYNFKTTCALKKLFLTGVEVTATLPNSDTYKDLLMKKLSFRYAYTSTLFCLINKTGAYHINALEYPFNFFWVVEKKKWAAIYLLSLYR